MAAPSGEIDNKPSPSISVDNASTGRIIYPESNKIQHANSFQRFTDFIDENIRLFRTSISITAAIGVLLIARSIRVYQRFSRVSDIPSEFINKNMKLYGSFVELKYDPVRIIVQHTPIFDLRRLWRRAAEDANGSLPLHLAGLELHEGSGKFLRDRLQAHPSLRFHMLRVNQSKGLDCIVDLTKWKKFPFKKTSLNEELLSQGLAKVAPLSGLRDQALQTRLTQRLLTAELRAEKKSRGVWMQERGPTTLDVARARLSRLTAAFAPGLRILGKIVMMPGRSLMGLRDLLRRKTG